MEATRPSSTRTPTSKASSRARTPRSSGSSRARSTVTGRLVIGEGAQVDAKVTADAAEIARRVQGRAQGAQPVLLEKARVEGTLDAQSLAVREGAQLNGAVNAGATRQAAAPRPARRGSPPGDPPRAGARASAARCAATATSRCTRRRRHRGRRAGRPHLRRQPQLRAAPGHHPRLGRDRRSRTSRRRCPACSPPTRTWPTRGRRRCCTRRPRPAPGVHPVGAGAIPPRASGADVHVGALAVVGAARARRRAHASSTPTSCSTTDVEIGEDCVLHSGVQVREGCRLGNRVVVQNGAVIGGDGFGFARDERRPLREDPAGRHRGGRGRRRDRRPDGHRPRRAEARRASAAAPRSTTWCRSATRSRSARTPCWPARWASRAARGSATGVTLAGQVGVAGHLTIGDGVDRHRADRASRRRSSRARSSPATPPSTTAPGSRPARCSRSCPSCRSACASWSRRLRT